MSEPSGSVTHPVWFTFSTSALAVALGGLGGALICHGRLQADAVPELAWVAVGLWLSAVLSVAPTRAAKPPLSSLPWLSLLSALSSLLPLPAVNANLVGLTLGAYAVVIGSCIWRWYRVRLISSLACAAGISTLHAVSVLCRG